MNTVATRMIGAALLLQLFMTARLNAQESEPGDSKPSVAEDERRLEPLFGEWVGVSYQWDGNPPRIFRGKQKAHAAFSANGYEFAVTIPPDVARSMHSFGTKRYWDADFTKTPQEFSKLADGKEGMGMIRTLWAKFQLEGDRLTWCETSFAAAEAGLGEFPPEGKALKSEPGDKRLFIYFQRAVPRAKPKQKPK